MITIHVKNTVSLTSDTFSCCQVIEKDPVESPCRVHRNIVDTMLPAFPFVQVDETIHGLPIRTADLPWLGLDLFPGLHILEYGIPVETEGPFHRIKNVEDVRGGE